MRVCGGVLGSNRDDIFKYKHINIFLSEIKLGLVISLGPCRSSMRKGGGEELGTQ